MSEVEPEGLIPEPEPAGPRYAPSDSGNAERLVAQRGKDMRYCDAAGGWFTWTGKRWEPDNGQVTRWAKESARTIPEEGRGLDAEALASLRKFAVRQEDAGKLAAAVKLAASEPGVAIPAEDFDAKPMLLVARDKTIDLEAVQFRAHRRADLARMMAAADVEEDAAAPAWEAFLAEALPDPEVRRYLQKLVGYSLRGGNPERLLVFVIGPSSTGKSTFIETLAGEGGVLGDYGAEFDLTLFRSKANDAPRPDLLRVLPKRLIYTTEANSEWRLHADQIKRMTGGDTISARGMYSNKFVSRVPHFTPWVVTNDPPTVEQADAALWRRLIAVPFDSRPAEEDARLRGRLLAERSGVLSWALEGWLAYSEEGLTDQPPAVVETTMRLRESLSDLDRFIAEVCEVGGDYTEPSADLYAAYREWAYRNELGDREMLKGPKFYQGLGARGYGDGPQRRVGDRDKDRKVRTRRGLRLARGSAVGP